MLNVDCWLCRVASALFIISVLRVLQSFFRIPVLHVHGFPHSVFLVHGFRFDVLGVHGFPHFVFSTSGWPPKVDGTEDRPITIRRAPGTEREEVILKGEEDESRVLEILHSYYIIEVRRYGEIGR